MAKEPVRTQVAASAEIPVERKEPKTPAELVRQFVKNTRSSERPRQRNQKTAGGWLYSPGSWNPFIDGHRLLLSIAKPEHLVDGVLKRVQVGGFVGEKRIYLWPTLPTDVDGLEVRQYGSRFEVNMADFLVKIKQRPEVGVAQRFDLVEADQESPVQPALMINLDKPLARKYFETTSKKKTKSRSQAPQPSQPPQPSQASQASKAPSAETSSQTESK